MSNHKAVTVLLLAVGLFVVGASASLAAETAQDVLAKSIRAPVGDTRATGEAGLVGGVSGVGGVGAVGAGGGVGLAWPNTVSGGVPRARWPGLVVHSKTRRLLPSATKSTSP